MNPEYQKCRLRTPLAPADLPESFAVVTAHNPSGKELTAGENSSRNEQLQQQIFEKNFSFFPVTGFDPGSDYAEPGYGINCTEDEAIALAKSWDQEAIFYVEDWTIYLTACADGKREVHGTWDDLADHSPAD